MSTATVSYVLNGTANISPQTREKVLAAVEALGYRPSGIARGLAARRTRVFGLISPPGAELAEPEALFAGLLKGIAKAAYRNRYAFVLAGPEAEPREAVASLRDRGVEGVILLAAGSADALYLDACKREGLAVVFAGEPALEEQVCHVGSDNLAGARDLTAHLLSLGHSVLAHLAGPADLEATGRREAGFQVALLAGRAEARASGTEGEDAVAPNGVVEAGDGTEESGFQCMHRLLSLPPKKRPTAVVAFNDAMAIGAIHAAREKGLVVPDDIAVAGFGDDPVAAYIDPPLTTVRVPAASIGEKAAEVLFRLLEGEDDPTEPPRRSEGEQETTASVSGVGRRILLAPRLIIRQSCGSALWI